LSPLDFFSAPRHAVRFLGYRIVVAAILVASAVLIRRARRRATMHWLVFLGVLASAVALVALIMYFGGHQSPYLIGLVLVAVVVLGLVPAEVWFAALLAGTIFTVYLVPILLWDVLREPLHFAVTTALFAGVLATGVIIRWFHLRHLVQELSLRHDLTLSRERLEVEVARHTRTDAALRESRDFLTSITAAAMDAIVMIDPDGVIRFWNTAAESVFGYSAAEALGRGPFTFLMAPEAADAVLEDYRAWQATGATSLLGRRTVSRGLRKSGESFPLELAIAPVAREGRRWACALLTDVTERTRNEERLRLFAAAVEGAAEGFYLIDLEGRILYVNRAVEALSGVPPEEYIGKSVMSLHADPGIPARVIMPAVRRTGRWAGEIAGRARGGRPLTLWLTASLVRDDAGRPIAMVGITKDLSEQRRLDEDRVKSQKLESIGVLAGGLAHDFNNLLTIILGNIDLARVACRESVEAVEALDHAAEAALRAGDLTRQLITFSKGGQPVKRVGNIARSVRETVLFAATGSSVACEFDIPEDLPPVEFDEGQMRQVIHNLVQNAREAMPGGGTLRVSAGTVQLSEGQVAPLAPGRYLRLEFADCGTGIPREHLNRIFDPYFSTKEMDAAKGRGLGLAVSYSIVRSHGGAIAAVSRPGGGATVTVYLPAAGRDPEREAAEKSPGGEAPPPDKLAAGAEREPEGPPRGRVLVMDDEPLVLEMSGAALRQLGYAATLCRSGAEAIVQYQIGLDAGRRFDAVILDLTVPGGLGGPETLARLRQIDPGVRAILSSGYVNHPAVTEWPDTGFAAFIAKPYSLKALEELLAALL
jgi:PAS domain S-box-containing protein